jgi:hypothetical protein
MGEKQLANSNWQLAKPAARAQPQRAQRSSNWQLAKPTAKALTTKGTKETQRNSKSNKLQERTETSTYLRAEKSEGSTWSIGQ